MKSLENKLIVYDSNCRVCTSLRSIILLITSIPAGKTIAYRALPADLQKKVDLNRFRNEMALIDTTEDTSLYGAEGVMVIFNACWPWFRILMRFSVFRFLFRHFYKTIAFNRYVIAPPDDLINCDCYPETNARYRAGYMAVCIAGAVLLTGLFGASVSGLYNIPAVTGAGHMLLIAGTGWLFQLLIAYFTSGRQFIDYAGHWATIMFAGVLPLLISGLILPLMHAPSVVLPCISVGISFPLMLYMHIRRARFIGVSQWLTVFWVISLAATALFWIKILGYATI